MKGRGQRRNRRNAESRRWHRLYERIPAHVRESLCESYGSLARVPLYQIHIALGARR